MNALVLAVVLALLVPLVTRGSYGRLLGTRWRWGSLLALGLVVQVLLAVGVVPRSRWHDVGFGLLVASYVLVLAFCGANVLLRGMAVVLVGVALNAFVVTIDQGMPVDVPHDWSSNFQPSVKHHLQGPGDHLVALGDVIVLPGPLDTVVSFGDLIVVVGLVDVAFHASRRRRARSARDRGSSAPPPDPDRQAREALPGGDAEAPARPGRGSPRPHGTGVREEAGAAGTCTGGEGPPARRPDPRPTGTACDDPLVGRHGVRSG